MKKIFIMLSMLLSCGLFYACSNSDTTDVVEEPKELNGPIINNVNLDDAEKVYVSIDSLPDWLISRITSAEEKAGKAGVLFREGEEYEKLFRGELDGTVYYYIYQYASSCIYCDSYYEDGTPLDFENEEVKQAFDSSIAQMKRIIIN